MQLVESRSANWVIVAPIVACAPVIVVEPICDWLANTEAW
jgi:hypothetical protein